MSSTAKKYPSEKYISTTGTHPEVLHGEEPQVSPEWSPPPEPKIAYVKTTNVSMNFSTKFSFRQLCGTRGIRLARISARAISQRRSLPLSLHNLPVMCLCLTPVRVQYILTLIEQRRERERLEMQAGAAGAAGAADPSAVATVPRDQDQLARLLKRQQRENMDHAKKRIKQTVEMLRLLHCTALH